MKKVLFVATEAEPFISTGGLGDAVGSLPQALRKQDIDAAVILPEHDRIPAHWREQMELIQAIVVPLGWRRQYCGIKRLELDGLTYYFIDNEYYFKRPALYGCFDDAERFAYFCRAVLESLPYLDFKPEVLHCHEWHTALVPVLLKAHYQGKEAYPGLKTMLTIHNIEYQGVFEAYILEDMLDLDPLEYFTFDKIEFYGQVNFLKAGIVYADAITTVSPGYAEEILTPDRGWGLDSVLRQRREVFHGVLNGIDRQVFDPAADKAIFANYSWQAPEAKAVNKLDLQKYLGLPVREDVPVLGLISRLEAARGLGYVTKILDEMMAMDLQLVVLGSGSEQIENVFQLASHHYPTKLSANIFFEETLARRIFAAADLYLVPSLKPCGSKQMIALRYGCVPVVRQPAGQADIITPYDANTGEGNGFLFSEQGPDNLLNTLVTATSLFRDRSRWPHIVATAMKTDVGWRHPAAEYSRLYHLMAK